jgi:hypothetical protein
MTAAGYRVSINSWLSMVCIRGRFGSVDEHAFNAEWWLNNIAREFASGFQQEASQQFALIVV